MGRRRRHVALALARESRASFAAVMAAEAHGLPPAEVERAREHGQVAVRHRFTDAGVFLRAVARRSHRLRDVERIAREDGFTGAEVYGIADHALGPMREEWTPGRPAWEVIPL